ncbi:MULTISPECIES: hypothetical protein [Microbispora]|uniref:DUF3040 domain-containing protein n=3 Tax=Microbispora TaxID=2005 RepID=A0ABY3LV85_9ACTN|nr:MULTISPECIES: hypothetical protein [Microbispora]GLW20881.1 hypothetical protein Mame01_09240 [Microbispora amethystogenes]MBO4272492.1 hypothetical protein [Microbispora triticiradicis]RGA06407.1 hypothetical protein DI270_003380 [Microbispora triticiradicis]TLP60624.1 hypothetical protein FED44_11990 [Microbispora fusca]TYB54642.1 hypothetical protein FXF59_22380 [Microbispora tritici]
MFHRKPLEERIAERVAKRPPLKEGKHFEHRPALIVFCVIMVLVALKIVGAFVLMKWGIT